MTSLLSGCGSVEGEATYRPFNVRHRRAAPTGSVKDNSLDSQTQTRATASIRRKQEPQSFAERLEAETSKKGAKLPIIIEASESEVDAFLENHEEDLHLRWRFWDGKFIVEELNSAEHETAVAACMKQLAAADGCVRGSSANLGPTLKAPEGYENKSGTIKPDACFWNIRRKVNRQTRENGMAANDTGNYYPSVVIEVGFSQKEESFKNKVAAWLRAGNERTGVRCVIEISLDDQTTPPEFLKFRVHRRNQAHIPRVSKITYGEYAKNPNIARYKKLILSEDVCYPDPVPEGFAGCTFDFGAVYAELPGVATSEEDDSSEDDESSEEDEHNNPHGGGVLGNVGSALGKHRRSED